MAKTNRTNVTPKPRPEPETAPPPPPPATVEVTEETLLATRGRALTLLAATGSVEAIRRALVARGYSEAIHREGWAALHAASGYSPGGGGFVSAEPDAVTDAQRALDAWDDLNFPIADASLRHRHPAAHGKLFGDGLAPAAGAESVVRVESFLDRVDALAKTDPDAVATLAARGITPEERSRARGLLAAAKAFRPVDPEAHAAQAKARSQSAAQRDAALRTLRAWYEEWSTIAKQVIRRKDWLILMGLATRKKPAKKPASA